MCIVATQAVVSAADPNLASSIFYNTPHRVIDLVIVHTVNVSDGTAVVSDTFVLTVTATMTAAFNNQPSQDWRMQFFGTSLNSGDAADLADPDHDGIANLAEFALSSDPTQADAVATDISHEGSDLTLTYTRRDASLAEVTVKCLWAENANGPWSNDGVTEEVLSDDGTVQAVKARFPINGASQKLLRLEITRRQ